MATLGSGSRLTVAQIEQLWINAGGDPGSAPLMAAIAIAESGGQSNILNDNPNTKDYSVGLWQINYYGNLLNGRTAAYGAPAALASSPEAQAKAAVALYANGKGIGNWKGDAAYKAWSRGQSLAQFGVDDTPPAGDSAALNNARDAAGRDGDATTSGSSPDALPTAIDSNFLGFLKSQAPQMERMVASDPQAVSLIEQWSSGTQLSDQEFEAQFEQTNWWKTTPQSQRQQLVAQATDPSTATQTVNNMITSINTTAAQMGVQLPPGQANLLALTAINNNWSTDHLNQHIASFAKYSGPNTTYKGDAGADVQQLQNLYASYAVPVSAPTLNQNLQDLLSGKIKSVNDLAQGVANTAATLYSTNPQLSTYLKNGQGTTKDWADPYLQQASSLLGLNPNSINLSAPMWSKVLQPATDPTSGKPTGQAMSLDQWNTMLRTDPTYGFDTSTTGVQEASKLGDVLRQTLGFGSV